MTDVSALEVTGAPSAPQRAGPVPSRAGERRAVGACVVAMTFVGGSVAVSGVLAGAPLFTAEAVRYAAASLLLFLFARRSQRPGQRPTRKPPRRAAAPSATDTAAPPSARKPQPRTAPPSPVITARSGRRPLVWPRRTEWLWLAGIAATGLVLFNIGLVQGSHDAEPAVLGVAVACVPPLLAVAGPLMERTRPRAAMVGAALVVTAGAGLIEGLGRTDAAGIGWAAVVFGCEVAFTLLAVPVLGRHGPWGYGPHDLDRHGLVRRARAGARGAGRRDPADPG
ncbi:MAG TPA: hypothetical protein VG268_06420 [Streptosporangiaceae bacterium]|nr:hypothetical protein [Streptosporangiaceae bacterium]